MPTSNHEDNTGHICAHSFDYDGCMAIFNHFKFSSSDWEICISRIHVIAEILNSALKEDVEQILLLNGSARQSARHDIYCRIYFFDRNGSDSGSAFYFLTELEKYLKLSMKKKFVVEQEREKYAAKIKIVSFLMSDLRDKGAHDRNFNIAINSPCFDKLYSEKDELVTVYNTSTDIIKGDETKISLVYAQMQKLASENENKSITFHFYDDSYSIISDLFFAYSYNLDLIPKNVKLFIHCYPLSIYSYTQVPEKNFSFQGTGTADKNYTENSQSLRDLLNSNLSQNLGLFGRSNALQKALDTFSKKLKDDYLKVMNSESQTTSSTDICAPGFFGFKNPSGDPMAFSIGRQFRGYS